MTVWEDFSMYPQAIHTCISQFPHKPECYPAKFRLDGILLGKHMILIAQQLPYEFSYV